MLGNLYFIAHYSHHADGAFGSSSAVKFLLMLSFCIVEGQILMLPLDVLNFREGTNVDMFVFWQVIYMSSLFMTTILLPFTYFFYETNEDSDYKTRFCTAFGNVIILLVVFSIINFPMFTSLRHSYIPVDSIAYDL
jgi:hypothetical protein